MIKDYLLQNWALILVSLAFVISLMTTVFLERKTAVRYYILIASTFLLSIAVFAEFKLAEMNAHDQVRTVLMAIRYSATPFLIALIIITLSKRLTYFIFLPALILLVLDIVSIFTGLVFSIDANHALVRGPLGFLPYEVAGGYCLALILILLYKSNKRAMEIIPILFLSFTLASGVILPFLFGSSFASLFATTIMIALFTYYEFTTLLLTKKDPLTGLLNRQAYYADSAKDKDSITALISIDMNGLKSINDNQGHTAGDKAIATLAECLQKAAKRRQSCYRVGGDEFLVLCRKNTLEEVQGYIERVRRLVNETPYSCSIGYSYSANHDKSIDALIRESDEMMYLDKQRHYETSGIDRRKR